MNCSQFGRSAKKSLGVILCAASFLFGAGEARAQTTFGTGTFEGILQSGSNNDESFGFISLVLTSSGAFSVAFNLGVNNVGYHYYAKSGRFDQSGHYHFEGPDPQDTRFAVARIIDLQLDSVSAPTRITGTMTDLTHTSSVEMERLAVYTLDNPAPATGAYTCLFSSGDAGVPASTGYGRVAIGPLGRILVAGRAPDGRQYYQGAEFSVDWQ